MRSFAFPRHLLRLSFPMILPAIVVASCTRPEGADGVFGSEAWSVEGPMVRIGSVEDADYAFQSVVALAMAPNGILHSLHRGEATIRRWDAGGNPAKLSQP